MIGLYSTLPELFICDCPICSEYFESFKQAKTRNDKEQLLNDFFVTDRNRNEIQVPLFTPKCIEESPEVISRLPQNNE